MKSFKEATSTPKEIAVEKMALSIASSQDVPGLNFSPDIDRVYLGESMQLIKEARVDLDDVVREAAKLLINEADDYLNPDGDPNLLPKLPEIIDEEKLSSDTRVYFA